jgi:anti-sigma factor RsiW
MNVRDRSCADILAHISSYLDGDLAATECDAIERHCRECDSCASVVAGLRHTVGLCREAGSAPLPDVVRSRAQESVRRLLAGKRSR